MRGTEEKQETKIWIKKKRGKLKGWQRGRKNKRREREGWINTEWLEKTLSEKVILSLPTVETKNVSLFCKTVLAPFPDLLNFTTITTSIGVKFSDLCLGLGES